ncbi:MAG TPA: hypothetical protein VMD99_01155 [Terriglobales bacterium]|nr:hypothetical protein [Terriglobales bacterium]
MFARLVEVPIYAEKKSELVKTVRREIVPILKKQPGFVELLPLFPENAGEKMIAITLWTEKRHAEKYAKEVFPKVEEIVKFFLTAPITYKLYDIETTLCEHLVEALTAAV